MKKYIFLLILLIAFGLWLVSWLSGDADGIEREVIDGKVYEVIKREVDTVVVPITQTVYRKGEDIYHDRPVYIEIQGRVDTAAIIARYNSLQPIRDTLTLDQGLGTVIIQDTLYRNQLRSRAYIANISQKTIYEKTFLREPHKAEYWVGVSGPVPALLVGYVPKAKPRVMYSAGVGFNGISLGLNYRLR